MSRTCPSCSTRLLSPTTAHKSRGVLMGLSGKRFKSTNTALHFYQNRQLELYAAKEANRLTLRQLVFFGRSMTEERLVKSANYVRTELPVRIAHRLRDLQALPFIVVTQEGVARVYELYWSAFEKFRSYPHIHNLEENEAFCSFLRNLLEEHAGVIPNLSLGLSLSSPYLPPDQLDSFMRRMLVSRISRRVLAEHHLSLSKGFMASSHSSFGSSSTTDSNTTSHSSHSNPTSNSPGGRASSVMPSESHVGIIDTGLDVLRSVEKCKRLLRGRPFWLEDFREEVPSGSGDRKEKGRRYIEGREWPEVIVDGHLDTRFPYIREHLEYIIFELLKNSMRATGSKHRDEDVLPPIRITIVAGTDQVGIRISDQGGGLTTSYITHPSDLFSFSHIRNAARLEKARLGALRSVSKSARGMKATVDEQVAALRPGEGLASGEEDVESEAGVAPHARIGIGLPMSNIFATYFGGSLELVSLDGWGTDAFVRLPKLGTNHEGIEV
ncbi:hypothetical protein JAAARDRAFT_28172 [Jaapia argillacea MUCL 33604]|uniref:Protein-serine/threonine kinase n=1 Tax=Jaapia argillacea MUCL 33604 TaxID=933084 RepID=A0A067QC60_9AGAM|nr:hypothetical protein JAAARDRAFT_28172 [Jaapia argillacea MUCL 33604]